MQPQNLKVHESKGQITLVELYTLHNCLPVSKDTYYRILHGLLVKGLIQIPGANLTLRESRQ